MNKKFAMLGMVVFAILLMTTGCSRNSKQVKSLQAQVGVLTDEMVRMDEALQETRSAIQGEESRKNQLKGDLRQSEGVLSSLHEEEKVIEGMYRTPSGFTLPSVQIQQALKNAGYYQGQLDGKIGSGTRAALKAFQGDNGLGKDGVCGRKTWSKLKAYLEKTK